MGVSCTIDTNSCYLNVPKAETSSCQIYWVVIEDTTSSAQNILSISHYNAYILQNKLFYRSYFPLKKLKM